MRDLYEEAFPGLNTFRILNAPSIPREERRPSPKQEIVPKRYFYSDRLRAEAQGYALLVVHSMQPDFAAGIKTAGPKIPVVWCGWGYDYYYLLIPEFGSLLLPETQELVSRCRGAGFGTLKKRIAGRIKRLIEKNKSLLGITSPAETGTLTAVADRIRVFSVLPSETEMVRKALPRLKAADRAIRYYTTEDTLSAGPDKMTGPDILLGNSPAATNNHIEALHILRDRLPKNSRIIVPLNYGVEKEHAYIRELCRQGRELFGKQFVPLTRWLPIADYYQYCRSCGVVIMNHRRQQALGTISAALFKGARVFLRPENPVYSWYRDMGVTVFTLDSLEDALEEAFQPLPQETAARNRKIVGEFWSRKNGVKAIRDLAFFQNLPASRP